MWIDSSDFLSFHLAEKYLWPEKGTTSNRKVYSVYQCLFIIITLGNLNYLIFATYHKAPFEELVLNLSWLTSLLFGHFLVYTCKSALKENWNYFELHAQFDYSRTRLNYMIKVQSIFVKAILSYIIITASVVFVVLACKKCDGDADISCGVVFYINIFLDFRQRPYREIFNLTFLFIFVYIVATVTLGFGFLQVLIMLQEDCLQEFKNILSKAQRTGHRRTRRAHLIKAYGLHQYSIKSWDAFANHYKWILFVQYMTTGYIAGLIVTSEMIKFDLMSLGHMTVYIFAILLLGIIGEKCKQLSEEFKDATFYAVPWDGDVAAAKFLMFMNINLRKEMVLPLGDSGVYNNKLSLLTFKMIYSCVMLFVSLTALKK